MTNNSGVTQHFQTPTPSFSASGIILFSGAANAGDNVTYTVQSAYIYFYQTSSLGNASITVNAGEFSSQGATLFFEDNSTAGTGTIVVNGATVAGAFGGLFSLQGKSNLGSAHVIAYGERTASAEAPSIPWAGRRAGGLKWKSTATPPWT